MGVVKFAEIVFADDKVQKIVPVSYIRFNRHDKRSIQPKHDGDFDPEHKYYVKWFICGKNGVKCDQKHKHKFQIYKANIFFLGESRSAVQTKSKNAPKRKRFRAKKILETSSSDFSEQPKVIKKKSKAAMAKGITDPKSQVILRKFQVNQFVAQRKKLGVITNCVPSQNSKEKINSLLQCNDCSFSCKLKKDLINHMHDHGMHVVEVRAIVNNQVQRSDRSKQDDLASTSICLHEPVPTCSRNLTQAFDHVNTSYEELDDNEENPLLTVATPIEENIAVNNVNTQRNDRASSVNSQSRSCIISEEVPPYQPRIFAPQRRDVHSPRVTRDSIDEPWSSNELSNGSLTPSVSGVLESQDNADDTDEEPNRMPRRRSRPHRFHRDSTPENNEEVDRNDIVGRVARSRDRRFRPTNVTHEVKKDYGHGEETIGEVDEKYCNYIKKFKPEILRDMKKWRQVRGLSPEGCRQKLFDEVEGQYYLGCNIYYGKKAWEMTANRDELKFLADVVNIFWSKETIRSRSLLYRKIKNVIPGETEIVPATPAKLNAYFRIYKRWLQDLEVPDWEWQARMNNATKIFTKISYKARAEYVDKYFQELDARTNADAVPVV